MPNYVRKLYSKYEIINAFPLMFLILDLMLHLLFRVINPIGGLNGTQDIGRIFEVNIFRRLR